MELTVYNNAMYDDVEKALVRDDTGEVLLKGDDYHDKISYQIQGIIFILHHLGLITYDDYAYIETDITSEDQLFDELGFYNPEEY